MITAGSALRLFASAIAVSAALSLDRFWRSQRETYRKRGIVYEAKGDRVRATADYDQADKLELQAMTKPSQAK